MKRRLLFATPLVITGCSARPVEQPREPEPIVVVTPDALVVEDEPERTWPPPDELVAKLKPLSGDRTIEDVCRRARCNPPPPYPKRKPDPVGPIVRHVTQLQAEGTGSRVRVSRSGPMDHSWTAAFVTNEDNPTQLPGGECKIVKWSFQEVECETALPPEQLIVRSSVRPVRLVPPRSLVERIDRERASWRDPSTGIRVRIINITMQGSDMIVTGASGRSHGVDKTWSASIVDDNEKPVLNGTCKVIRVDEGTTHCRTTLPSDAVRKTPYLVLEPPAP